jgi:hypothetical protein
MPTTRNSHSFTGSASDCRFKAPLASRHVRPECRPAHCEHFGTAAATTPPTFRVANGLILIAASDTTSTAPDTPQCTSRQSRFRLPMDYSIGRFPVQNIGSKIDTITLSHLLHLFRACDSHLARAAVLEQPLISVTSVERGMV